MPRVKHGLPGIYNATPLTLTDGDGAALALDSSGNSLDNLATLIAGEDLTNNKLVTEQRYSYGTASADTQIKASAGFIHTVSIGGITGTPTAGLLTIYDNTAESGTVVYKEWVFATVNGHTITLNVSCATGIYVGFDATLANVWVTVAYR